jgi:hypothetical protein
MAAVHDISIDQGASFSMYLTIKDESNEKIDLSGHVFRGKIKKDLSDTTTQANFSFTILNQENESTKGMVEVTLTPEVTASIQTNARGTSRNVIKMIYDIESVSPSGFVTRWVQGLALISPEVTK